MNDEPQPSTSRDADLRDSRITEELENELLNKLLEEEEIAINKKDAEAKEKENQKLNEVLNAEEYLEHKGGNMLVYEKEMFMDLVNVDVLAVFGK